MHNGGASPGVGTQANTTGVGNAHASGYNVINHFGKLVYREHFKLVTFEVCLGNGIGQLVYGNRTS